MGVGARVFSLPSDVVVGAAVAVCGRSCTGLRIDGRVVGKRRDLVDIGDRGTGGSALISCPSNVLVDRVLTLGEVASASMSPISMSR